ncbi:6-bladed beta-propeller [Parabacteroides sp. OttesenSCG-928-K15]|nr:6-bladed beta-propeller [Parabacteroides sp. OttesenSCG-928-K15]
MKQLVLFITFFLMVCCTVTEKEVFTADLRPLTSSMAAKEPLTTITQSIEVIPLETHDDALIGYIAQAMVDNQYIYILSRNKCFQFDKKGKYLRTIGTRGKGPQEYLSIVKMQLNNNIIQFHDYYSSRIVSYDNEGKYLSTVQIPPFSFNTVFRMNEELYVGYIPNARGYERNRFLWFKEGGSVVDSIPYMQKYNFNTVQFFLDEGSFSKNGETLYFKEYLNDTIFHVTENSVHPFLFLELGDMRARENARIETIPNDKTWFSNMARINLLGVSDRYILLTYKGLCIYDKKDKSTKSIDMQHNSINFSPSALSSDGKHLIAWSIGEGDNNPNMLFAKLKE